MDNNKTTSHGGQAMRTDIHRPTEINPEDYSFITCLEFPSAGALFPIRIGMDIYMKFLNEDRVDKTHRSPNACTVCGAWYNSGAIFLHHPTNKIITLGWQCAEKLSMGVDFAAEKRKGKSLLERATKKAKRVSGIRNFVSVTSKEVRTALKADHHICQDIRSKVISNPEWFTDGLSPKQEALVLKLWEAANTPKVEEKHVPVPSTDKRIQIEGEAVSVKWVEDHYSRYGGGQLKMTVKVNTDSGSWLCYGSVPTAVEDLERGQTVRFMAKVEQGNKDEHFGFFKRPTKAEIVA
jgi:hypothetical protein